MIRFSPQSLVVYVIVKSGVRGVNTFPQQVLEVVPGDMAGMEYATRGFISQHCVGDFV